MRILCLGGSYFVAPLRELGHQVLHIHHSGGADLVLTRPSNWKFFADWLAGKDFEPEFLLYSDDGNLPLLLEPEKCPCPSAYYSIDTYCNPWHISYSHGFDSALVAQKDFVCMFSQESLDAAWLPLFCLCVDAARPFAERDLPVAFVGTLGHRNNPEREPFLRSFRRQHPLVMLQGDYAPIFRRSRIVLNQTAFSEVNFRCFEAIACGAALLMEKCGNGLEDLFRPGVDILPPYQRGNARHAAAIAAEWLQKPEELAELAGSGQELVRRAHTSMARARTILALAQRLQEQAPHKERLAGQEYRRKFVQVAFGMIASEHYGSEKYGEIGRFYLHYAKQ